MTFRSRSGRGSFPRLAALLLLAPLAVAPASAQEGEAPDTTRYEIDPILVTATRGPRAITQTPVPVNVVTRDQLAILNPNSVSDVLRTLPGLDVSGVGANQTRPSIRGQTGQRILLLQDGIRMNNTRRESDFGELPALVDINAVERVEVVRGPASVLYGSDAIGGVINIRTERPEIDGWRGSASYRYGDVDGQRRTAFRLYGRTGGASIEIGGAVRSVDAYTAPAGSFGEITLADETRVLGSGVEDRNFDARVALDVGPGTEIFTKFERYTADDAGFGSVAPEDYAPGGARVDITYPAQDFSKVTFGLRATDLDAGIADRFELTAYGQDNERDLVFDFFTGFGPMAPPGAGVSITTENYTDIRTYGFRAEARKLLGDVLLTYGVDGFQDRAEGTDLSTTTVTGFGPPQRTVDTSPNIPTAEFLSIGYFAQAEFDVGERLSLVTGARYQDVSAETFATRGFEGEPTELNTGTAVASINALYELTDNLQLVTTVGRGFRAPNLVEAFFEGPVAEAGAYQLAAPDLEAETSLNVDLGARVELGRLFLEGFWFRNRIDNGIRAEATGEEIAGLDAFRNVNVDELVYTGFELNGSYLLTDDVRIGAGYSKLDTENELDPDSPVGEAFNSKFVTNVRYTDPQRRFWAQWDLRSSGEQRDVGLGSNPLGETIPGFTIQNLRAGVRLFELGGVENELDVALTNVTDELYAEVANAAFFRPEPGRNLTLTWKVAF